MSTLCLPFRLCLGLVLALAALAALAPTDTARAQAEQASITIYKSVCPEDYTGEDYFADCYDNPGNGFTFNLAGPGYDGGPVTTGGSGFTAFEGIDADGAYTLTELFPDNIVDYAVVCSAGGVAFPFSYVAGGIQLALTTSDDLRCDWYNIPVGPNTNDEASLTIYKAVCPEEYAGDSYFADCYDTPGEDYVFDLDGPGFAGSDTTGADGFAVFEGIATAGDYFLSESSPISIDSYVVNCSEGGVAFPFTYVEGGIEITLGVNDDLRCDWYNIPADNQLASVTIYKWLCSAGADDDDDFGDCFDEPGDSIDFALAGPSGPANATTGADGFAFFDGIDIAGTYTITEDFPDDVDGYAVFCVEAGEPFAVTTIEDGISLNLALDDDLRCDWYNVLKAGAPSPSPSPGGGVSTLPSTGAGADDSALAIDRFGWPLALAGIVAIAVLATAHRFRGAAAIRR
ncbi:MAG TPA: hypothetical protein VMP03_04950 [Methylomirabilota bacterium]|nr:hypothetical protein [Methylomirabilota bacterium]